MALETVKSLTQVARDIALVLAEIDNVMGFDVFIQYTNKKSTQKLLTYIKDRMETKICKQCGEEKPLTSEYWHKGNGKDGFCGKCRICRNKNNVEYCKTHKHIRKIRVDAHKEHLREYHRNYREINRDELKEKNKQYYISVKDNILKKYLQDNSEEISRKAKERREIMGYSKLHHDTDNYIDKYKIRPERCSICGGGGKIVAHHPSNDIWNEVVFCCYSCHQLIHTNKLECPKPIDLLSYKN